MDAKRLKEVLDEISTNPNAGDADIQVAGAICSILAHYKTPSTMEAEPEPNDATHHAKKKLQAADTYHGMGLDDIAKDELKHALYFIDMLRREAYTPEQQAIVKNLKMRHDLISQAI